VAGGGRLHGFADDLRGVGNRNQVEVFAESADQDRLPEAFDGILGLTVALTPGEKRLAGVGLRSKGEDGDGAGDGEFVFRVEKRKLEKRRRGVQRRGDWRRVLVRPPGSMKVI